MRHLRTLPRPGALVEITQRTAQGRFLLRPSRQVNALVVGCLARAQATTGASIHAAAFLSGHFHLLASFETAAQMAAFMGQLTSAISREVKKVLTAHDQRWDAPIFTRRYRSIPLSDEPEAQVARLRYVLAQGCKEGLVLSPVDWPGVHCAQALLEDRPLRGVWIDWTEKSNRGRRARVEDVTSEESLRFDPLPCWADASSRDRRRWIRQMVRSIEEEARSEHARRGTVPLGAARVCARHPHALPRERPAVRPVPRFHAVRRAVYRALLDGYRAFAVAYREAAQRLRDGLLGPSEAARLFPGDSFPPGLPYVPPRWGPTDPGGALGSL